MSKRLSYEQYKNRSNVGSSITIERNSQKDQSSSRIELRGRLMDSSKNEIILENYDETRAELRSTGHNLVRNNHNQFLILELLI